jgi:hypothetical protein
MCGQKDAGTLEGRENTNRIKHNVELAYARAREHPGSCISEEIDVAGSCIEKGQASFQSPALHEPTQFHSIPIGYNVPFVESTFPANRSSTIVA